MIFKKYCSSFFSFIDRLSSSKYALWSLFLVAVLTRILGAYMGGARLDDDGTHLGAATNFLAGKGPIHYMGEIPLTVWVFPGMGIFMAFFIYCFGPYANLAMRIFFVIMSSLTITLFFSLAKLFFENKYAFLAALTWILYPPQLFWTTRSNAHTYASNILIVSIFLLFVAWRKRSLILYFIIGILWSSIVYMRGEYLYGIFILMIGTYFFSSVKKEKVIFCGLLILGLVAGMSPWVIRNYHLHHRIIVQPSYCWNMFWMVFQPNYRFGGEPGRLSETMQQSMNLAKNEFEITKIYKEEFFKNIRKNPSVVFRTIGGNALKFWRPWLSFDAVSIFENSVYVISYGFVFAFFLIGLKYIPWKSPHWFVIYGFIIYKFLVHLPFYMIIRFREAIFPLFVLIAVLGIKALCEKYERT